MTEAQTKYIIFHRTERERESEREREIHREREKKKEEQKKQIEEVATRSYKGRQINNYTDLNADTRFK